MAENLPLRGLGTVGIVTDVHPYDLPAPALSAGVNVRFDNGKISRAPVNRRIYEYGGSEASHQPAYLFSIPPISTGAEQLISVQNDFDKIYSVTGSTLTDVTHAGAVANDTLEPFTSAFLGNVAYLNRKSRVPLKMAQSDSVFEDLPNWDSTWRAGVFRSYKDYLVALNVTKGAVDYPAMIKWSDATLYNDVPGSWDEGDPTTQAGENTLNDMRGPIIDGLALRDSFIIYGDNEVWSMDFTGGTFVFNFRKRFDDVGILSTNCVVEVDGNHFVFDAFDLYRHDGTSKQSIAHSRVKEFVFGGLIKDLKYLCFVAHNPKLNEVRFYYPSNDRYAYYAPTNGCNRAAVYNYRNDTWSFDDAPNVTAATLATLTTGETWASSDPTPWSEMGGTYMSSSDTEDRHTMFASRSDSLAGLTASRIYGLDLITGGRLTRAVDAETIRDAQAERIGVDLDENGTPLRAYKCVLGVYPQLSLDEDGTTIELAFGANDVVGASPAWDVYQSFDPETMTKLDSRVAGRYLGWRMRLSGNGDFGLSGMDVTTSIRGRRG